MRKVELLHLEVMNETEQLYVFGTMFNGQLYAQQIIMNTALPVVMQDDIFRTTILSLVEMKRKDAAGAEEIGKR